jgi:Lrp/AsnC family transcriptional regulator, leucine-responsive regulatory protein
VKRLRFQNGLLDTVDVALVRLLARDARATMADLARAVGLSPPSVAERVRRLEEAGVIRGYAAVVDPAALGLSLAAYIRIRPLPGLLGKMAEVLVGLSAIV